MVRNSEISRDVLRRLALTHLCPKVCQLLICLNYRPTVKQQKLDFAMVLA